MKSTVYHCNVQLTRGQASLILDGARQYARQAELPPLTLVVLDSGGNLIAAEREDGCAPLRFPVAKGKAYAAVGIGVSSGESGQRNSERPAFLASVATASQGKFIPVAGGVLILNETNHIIGAIGISGASSDEDQQAAIAGIEAGHLQWGLAP